jgi:hypothetical protein
MLTEAEATLRRSGVTLCLAELNRESLQMIERSPLGMTLGRARLLFTLQEAVDHWAASMGGTQSQLQK